MIQMTKDQIKQAAPVLNYLKQLGISNKFLENNITFNPNTKYYLTYYKDINLDLPPETQEQLGIYINHPPKDKIVIHKIFNIYITERKDS